MKVTVTPAGGLFGPQSITWRVHTEIYGWPATLRSFQLQALHPRTIRGITQNCLLDDPEVAWARLRGQLDFVAVRTFGTREQAEQAGERVRRIHARLIGLDTDTGTLFRVADEENLCWAHCAEVASHLEIARRSGVPLTGEEQDAYVAEQRRSAALVGLPERAVPGDVAALEAYLDGMRPYLAATHEAREALRRSLSPQVSLRLAFLAPPLVLGSLPAAGALVYATLPGWAKVLYGCRVNDAAEFAADTALKALRVTARAMPARLVAGEIRAARALMPVRQGAGAPVAA